MIGDVSYKSLPDAWRSRFRVLPVKLYFKDGFRLFGRQKKEQTELPERVVKTGDLQLNKQGLRELIGRDNEMDVLSFAP